MQADWKRDLSLIQNTHSVLMYFWLNALACDTWNNYQRASGDESWMCCHLRLGQKVALEHTSKITCKGQLACMFCACVRWNNSPYQQGAVVCICHSKRKRETRTAAIQTINIIASLAFQMVFSFFITNVHVVIKIFAYCNAQVSWRCIIKIIICVHFDLFVCLL